MKRLTLPLILATLFLATGCDSSSSSLPDAPKVQMQIDTDNLIPLAEGFIYKGWAKVGELYYATSGFNVTQTGQFLTEVGAFRDKSFVLAADISGADIVMISIEGKRGGGAEPSGSVVLAADVTSGAITLSISHSAALGAQFAGQTGQFTVMTPSDVDPSNETNGVWFVTGSGDNLEAALSLPPLPQGWAYEGWVESGGVLLSTGRFTSNSGNDLASPFSFPDVPLFPGEDFLINAPSGVTFPFDVSGATVTITAEPQPDDTPLPYGIRVLRGQIPASVQGGTVHQLSGENVAPSATITIF